MPSDACIPDGCGLAGDARMKITLVLLMATAEEYVKATFFGIIGPDIHLFLLTYSNNWELSASNLL